MKPITVILFVILLVACGSKQEFRRTRNLNEITGQTFVLPANPKWVILDRNTAGQFNRDTNIAMSVRDTAVTLAKEPRLVVYLNGSACTPCALKELKHWKPIIKQLNEQILFILQTTADNQIVKQALMEQEFDFPVMCDEKSDFARYNLLPINELFHVFLLDAENKVRLVGNPIISLKQFDNFKNVLKSLIIIN